MSNRESDRVSALILHDVHVSPTLRHARGSVAQLRGDVFDIEHAAGRCVDVKDAPSVLPDPLPGDTVSPAAERQRRLVAQSAGRADIIKQRQADEAAADLAHRAALQAGHDVRGPLLAKREVFTREAKIEAENEARAAKRKKKDP